MGCDYFIIKLLRIYYKDNEYLEIELEREKGYYDDYYQFDEDADDFEEKINNYIEQLLTPKVDPITIYVNKQFNKSSCESKYKPLVESAIKNYDIDWGDIIKVMKVEVRHQN
jgi:chromosomal replication initiation ATPase DnaA